MNSKIPTTYNFYDAMSGEIAANFGSSEGILEKLCKKLNINTIRYAPVALVYDKKINTPPKFSIYAIDLEKYDIKWKNIRELLISTNYKIDGVRFDFSYSLDELKDDIDNLFISLLVNQPTILKFEKLDVVEIA